MNYLFFAITLIFFIGYYFLIAKFERISNNKYTKGLPAYFLIVAFFIRFLCFQNDGYYSVLTPDIISGLLGWKKGEIFIATTCAWISVTAFMIAVLNPFFKIKSNDVLTRFFVPLAVIFNLIFLKYHLTIETNADIAKKVSLFSATFMIELAIELAISVRAWREYFVNGRHKEFKFDALEVLKNLGILVLVLVITMPTYYLQYNFGFLTLYLRVIDFSPTHRLFIYASIFLPLAMYFGLREKDEEIKRYAMILFSVSTMITFSVGYSFKGLSNLSAWPLHLCNTAMFIIPLCLIFKLNRLFYFTYFINVLGALFAMLLPNYAEDINVISHVNINFWINHWCAFFMPLLIVALDVFKKPTIKSFSISFIWFFVYYVIVLVLNVYLTAHGEEVDFFFINSNFIADKLGNWAENIFNKSASFKIGEYTYTFHPLYQLLYFIVYILLGLGTWFVYEQFFAIAKSHRDLRDRRIKRKEMEIYLKQQLNGRSIDEPMNKDAGIRLELKGFSKRYAMNKHYAVKDANLVVHGGEIFGFLGPNGAGKSTIIKSIVGIQPITEGSIEVCGYDCATQPVMAKKLIGYVPDHYALYEKLSGREYINYIADIFGVSKEDRDERIEKYVQRFELSHSIDNPIKTYSHGMKQKITIMAALVHDPKVWILDEPLTGLDPNSIFQVKECMREHAEKGNIVFFSSHIMEVVEKLCNRITIIKKGQIQVTTSIEEIEKNCSLEEFYLKTIQDEGEK